MALRQETVSLLASLARPAAAAASTSAPRARRSYSAAGTAEVRRSESDGNSAVVLSTLRPEPELPAASGSGTTSNDSPTTLRSAPASISTFPPLAYPLAVRSSEPAPSELTYPESSSWRLRAMDRAPDAQRRPASKPEPSSAIGAPGSTVSEKIEEPDKPSDAEVLDFLRDPSRFPPATLTLARKLVCSKPGTITLENFDKQLREDFRARVGRGLLSSIACSKLISFASKWHRQARRDPRSVSNFDAEWLLLLQSPPARKKKNKAATTQVPSDKQAPVPTDTRRPSTVKPKPPAPPPVASSSSFPTLDKPPSKASLQHFDRPRSSSSPVSPRVGKAAPAATSSRSLRLNAALGQSLSAAPPMPTLESTMSSLQHLIEVFSTSLAQFASDASQPLATHLSFPEALEARQRQAKVQQAKDVLELMRQALQGMFPGTGPAAAALQAVQAIAPAMPYKKERPTTPSEPPKASSKKQKASKKKTAPARSPEGHAGEVPPQQSLAATPKADAQSPAPEPRPKAEEQPLPSSSNNIAQAAAPTRPRVASAAQPRPVVAAPLPEFLPALSTALAPERSSSVNEEPLSTLVLAALSKEASTEAEGRSKPTATQSSSTATRFGLPSQRVAAPLTTRLLSISAPSQREATARPNRNDAAAAADQKRLPPPGPPKRDLTKIEDYVRGGRYKQLVILTDGNNVPPPRRLMPSEDAPAKSALAREALEAYQRHTPEARSSSSKIEVHKTAALDAATAAPRVPDRRKADPDRPIVVRSHLVHRSRAAASPPRPTPPPAPPAPVVQLEADKSSLTPAASSTLEALLPEEDTVQPMPMLHAKKNQDQSLQRTPLEDALKKAVGTNEVRAVIQTLEKTTGRNEEIVPGSFWTALVAKGRKISDLSVAALPMLKADRLQIEPPSPSQMTILREVLFTILRTDARQQAKLKPSKSLPPPPLPLTCRSLRLFLNASPADPVICALVLKGFALLGTAGAQDFHELEEVILTRSASAPFEPIPDVDPERESQHAVWALEALDSIRPFVHPRVLRCWAGVIDPNDLHYHRSRLITIADHFASKKPKPQAKVKGERLYKLAHMVSFPLPEMPPAVRLIDAYVETSLSSLSAATDPYARYAARRAWSRADPAEDAVELLETAEKRFGPLAEPMSVEQPLATHADWARDDLKNYHHETGTDSSTELLAAVRRVVQSDTQALVGSPRTSPTGVRSRSWKGGGT